MRKPSKNWTKSICGPLTFIRNGTNELIVTNDSHFNVLKQINFPHIDVKTIQEYIKRALPK